MSSRIPLFSLSIQRRCLTIPYPTNNDGGVYRSEVTRPWLDDISGYCQDLERVGCIAVDVVADRLFQNNRGMTKYPSSTLLTSKFNEDQTLLSSRGMNLFIGSDLSDIGRPYKKCSSYWGTATGLLFSYIMIALGTVN